MLRDPLATDVGDVCDRLSTALGWRVDFSSPEDCAHDHKNAPSAVWSEPVHAGEAAHGSLRLNRIPSTPPRAELPVAVATTEVVSHLLKRLRTVLQALESRSREFSTLMELGRPDQNREGLSASLQRLLNGAAELTGFWSSAFLLIDPVLDALRLRSSWRIDVSRFAQSQRSLEAPSPDAQALLRGSILLDRKDPRSAAWLPQDSVVGLGVPVSSAEGPLGTLWCYDRRQKNVNQHTVKVLQSIAVQIARALERTVLLRESAVRQRLRKELKAASRHQGISRTLPIHAEASIDVAMRAASASELSGDLCEVCPLDTDRTFLALGDAVGHSIPAAMVMAVARGALRTLLDDGGVWEGQPEMLIRRINRTLCSMTGSEQFMSVVAGILDHRAGTLTYSNAGHPPPWLIRGGKRTPLKSHGMLCGVLTEAAYQQSVIPLASGDLLVFFTDGITEALSPDRQLFRADGILESLSGQRWASADAAADAIWQRLAEHVGHRDATDDQTLLVVSVR